MNEATIIRQYWDENLLVSESPGNIDYNPISSINIIKEERPPTSKAFSKKEISTKKSTTATLGTFSYLGSHIFCCGPPIGSALVGIGGTGTTLGVLDRWNHKLETNLTNFLYDKVFQGPPRNPALELLTGGKSNETYMLSSNIAHNSLEVLGATAFWLGVSSIAYSAGVTDFYKDMQRQKPHQPLNTSMSLKNRIYTSFKDIKDIPRNIGNWLDNSYQGNNSLLREHTGSKFVNVSKQPITYCNTNCKH